MLPTNRNKNNVFLDIFPEFCCKAMGRDYVWVCDDVFIMYAGKLYFIKDFDYEDIRGSYKLHSLVIYKLWFLRKIGVIICSFSSYTE